MDKEELLGGFVAMLLIALFAWVMYACVQQDKQDEMLLRKYPECVTAGKPMVCARYKKMLEQQ